MHKINKGEPSDDFKKFNRKRHTQRKEANGHTHIWREHIIEKEQDGLSGYTEAPITVDNSHIDHFRKQELFQDYIFRWENYVADSKDEDYGAKYKDNKAGIKTKEDNLRLVNPVEEDAERFFYYEANGKMIPTPELSEQEKQRAQFTIDSFNLNHKSLMERRMRILSIDLNPYDGFSRDELMESLCSNGFPSVAAQTIDEWLEQMEEKQDDEQ